MKNKLIVAGVAVTALAFLSGCAGVNANKSIGTAGATKAVADESNIAPAQTESAQAKLDSAVTLQAAGNNIAAAALADQSTLEYKLAIATAERDEAKKEDAKVEKELRADVERKLIYQSILDQETNNGGAN